MRSVAKKHLRMLFKKNVCIFQQITIVSCNVVGGHKSAGVLGINETEFQINSVFNEQCAERKTLKKLMFGILNIGRPAIVSKIY